MCGTDDTYFYDFDFERRSEAAVRGWETRRRHENERKMDLQKAEELKKEFLEPMPDFSREAERERELVPVK